MVGSLTGVVARQWGFGQTSDALQLGVYVLHGGLSV